MCFWENITSKFWLHGEVSYCMGIPPKAQAGELSTTIQIIWCFFIYDYPDHLVGGFVDATFNISCLMPSYPGVGLQGTARQIHSLAPE
jgi:hypothetical protein